MAIKTFTAGSVLTAADTNTYLANSGLVYITKKSFTTGTWDCSSIFTDTYKDYLLIANCSTAPAGAQIVEARLMNGATPTTGGTDYKFYELGHTWGGTADATPGTGGAYWFGFRSTSYWMGTMTIQSPKVAAFTVFQTGQIDSAQSVTSRGVHTAATAYDGIQFKVASGSMTGDITVYGYRQA